MVNAEIHSIDPDSGTCTEGETVTTTVNVENTGVTNHTFYVGYTVHGPDGTAYDNDGTTGEPVSLNKGDWTLVDVEWEVEVDVPVGSYDVQVSVWEENDPDNLKNRLTDGWEYDVFSVEEVEDEIDAEINSLNPESKVYTEGERVTTTVGVENTGDVDNTFYVGYTMHGLEGGEYDNNETTGTSVSLTAGDWDEIDLEWDVESDAPKGPYDVQVSVWEESDPNNLNNRLADRWEYDAFNVEDAVEEVDTEIYSIEPDSGSFAKGEMVTTTVGVENTGDVDHTFYVGYTIHGPEGGEYDNNETTGTSVSLTAGDWDEIDLEWDVESNAPKGPYDVQVSVWEESDPNNLNNRLSNRWEYGAFSIENAVDEIDAEINSIDFDSRMYAEGETVTTTVNVE